MAEKKPKTTVENVPGEPEGKVEAAAPAATMAQEAQAVPKEAHAASNPIATARRSVAAWLKGNFPGHENAFIGGLVGLILILLIFAIGFWRTFVVALFVCVGIAVGQVFDGDPKIIRTVQRFLESRNG